MRCVVSGIIYLDKHNMRVAVCFTGTVTSNKPEPHPDYNKNNEHYIRPCFEAYKRHFFDTNSEHELVVYMHFWADGADTAHVELLKSLYQPARILTQPLEVTNRFVSKYMSLSRVVDLTEGDFDMYVFLRPDVMIMKNVSLSSYDPTIIYHNDGCPLEGGHFGDMYYAMNMKNAIHFAKLAGRIMHLKTEIWTEHKWRHEYIPVLESHLTMAARVCNDLRAGQAREIEVFRKI